MNDEDWLDIGAAESEPPSARLPVVSALPTDIVERARLVEDCWSRLSIKQKMFLSALRDNHFNVRRTAEYVAHQGNGIARRSHYAWLKEEDYGFILRVWEANAARAALNPERLLIRQDAIVEEALTPKPILYQGEPTGYQEIDLSTAARANIELLDRAVPKGEGDKTRVVVNVVRLTGEHDPDE